MCLFANLMIRCFALLVNRMRSYRHLKKSGQNDHLAPVLGQDDHTYGAR